MLSRQLRGFLVYQLFTRLFTSNKFLSLPSPFACDFQQFFTPKQRFFSQCVGAISDDIQLKAHSLTIWSRLFSFNSRWMSFHGQNLTKTLHHNSESFISHDCHPKTCSNWLVFYTWIPTYNPIPSFKDTFGSELFAHLHPCC